MDYDLHLKDEKYWKSLFYMILTLLGYKISAEFKTVKGRIDAVIETHSHIYDSPAKRYLTADGVLTPTDIGIPQGWLPDLKSYSSLFPQ